MTTRYWVGGTGAWSDTAHWAGKSGGVGGASVPTAADDVRFDANSFSAAGQTVTTDIEAACHDLNWTGALHVPTFNVRGDLTIAGSLTLIPAMTVTAYALTTTITFTSSVSRSVTSAGHVWGGRYTFDGSGSWTLQDDLRSLGNWALNRGTFDANGKNVAARIFSCNSGQTRTLKMGSGTWTLTPLETVSVWNFAAAGLTYDAGQSVVVLDSTGSDAMHDFHMGGMNTHHSLTLKGSGKGLVRFRSTIGAWDWYGTLRVGGDFAGNVQIESADGGTGRLDFTDYTGTFHVAAPGYLFGITKFSPTMTFTQDYPVTFVDPGVCDLAGKVFTKAVTFDKANCTFQLRNFVCTDLVTLTRGTVVLESDVSSARFASNNANVRTLTMGSYAWALTGSGLICDINSSLTYTVLRFRR